MMDSQNKKPDSKPIHVLVLALSVFPKIENNRLSMTTYAYGDEVEGIEKLYTCQGYYQLEVIPRFIKEHMQETISHVIMLATDRTKTEEKYFSTDGKDAIKWTVVSYFKDFLKGEINSKIEMIVIDVDERKPEEALEKTMGEIRKLYQEAEDKNEWRLWMDTHGGFRDVSMVLVSAARFFGTDRNEPIVTNKIYSVYHSQDDKPDLIVDQTGFYFSRSAEALKNFMHYGKYLSVDLQKCDGSNPYAFVSYKHDTENYVSIRNFFMMLKNQGVLFWFDDGIGYREDWRERIDRMNSDSSAFIALLTNSYFESEECWKELLHALGQNAGKQDKIHVILLEDNISFPSGVPDDMTEAKKLQKDLGISNDQIKQFFYNPNWLKWFQYMKHEDSIQQRLLDDPGLIEALKSIRESLLPVKDI